jgi:hypothetical protein
VALDQWRFFVHSFRDGTEFVAESEGEAVIFSGTVAQTKSNDMWREFEQEKLKLAVGVGST